MAIFYFRPSIIRASSGKCAVASAAYQSAEKLHDNRLGQNFSYRTKEEVVHTEILLPQNAPKEYLNRETLWNAVEKSQNKINSRYARQIIVAIPNEWSRAEAIERIREYIQTAFVDKGMCADWAYHEKEGNHHVHIMLTLRAIGNDGNWLPMEKKVFALDETGERIPKIDPLTGEQQIREHNKNGKIYVEKLWERITIMTNAWNSREQLHEWKRLWAEHCNKYLEQGQCIDHRSYEEQGIDKVGQVHVGYASHYAVERGKQENDERRSINAFFEKAHTMVKKAKEELMQIIEKIKEVVGHDQRKGIEKERFGIGVVGNVARIPNDLSGVNQGTRAESEREGQIDATCKRLSEYRHRLEYLTNRIRQLTSTDNQPSMRESKSENVSSRQRIK